ncbi:MAG: hypothetical protein ACOCRK_07980 [bacterium]
MNRGNYEIKINDDTVHIKKGGKEYKIKLKKVLNHFVNRVNDVEFNRIVYNILKEAKEEEKLEKLYAE